MIKLCCYIEGQRDIFSVSISPNLNIDNLKKQIYSEQHVQSIVQCNPSDLALTKIYHHADAVDQRRLRANEKIFQVWPEPPSDDKLHVFVGLPGGADSPILVGLDDKPVDVDSDLVQEYKDIFIKVKEWGFFEDSDIRRNGLHEYNRTRVPDFVAEFEQKLDSKPGLASDVNYIHDVIHNVAFLDAYFGPLKRGVEDGSPEESPFENESHRAAGRLEVIHVAHVAAFQWGRYWCGDLGIKVSSMNSIFLHSFALHPGDTTKVLTSNHQWPFSLIVKCEDIQPVYEQLRQYWPRNDLLLLKSNLPRLLVEVDSKPKEDWPENLIRMLLMGGAIVRFANRFMANKNFVLFAIYIWESGEATHYSLFQEPNNQGVCYKKASYCLYASADCAKFVRHLYNLRHMVEMDKETEAAEAEIQRLKEKIEQHDKEHPMKSLYTNNKRKCSNNDVDDQGADRSAGGAGRGARGVSATDFVELGAHGYKVKPPVEDIVDEKGGVLKALGSKMPSHILTVYEQSDPSKSFIAKKVHEQSNELEFLNYLNTFQPKSEHIISLHEYFQTQSTSWAILPEMDTIADYLSFVPHRLSGKVAQVCWGLIKGIAYLHKFCIAHRDIKPENLVVDRNFCLKIIDFDVAMKVNDEDEVVDGQCGTEGWMAPEMEEKSMYSPIKADRWSTGQVLLYLLDEFENEDTVLRATARKLTTHNPDLRSPMLLVPTSFSDVVNVAVERKASRSLQDTVEIDGENANFSRVKRQKLSVPNEVLEDIRQ